MSPNLNDNLFSFFRSRLKASQKEADWNTPPDSVFENAMSELNKLNDRKNRRRIIPIIFFLSSALILIFGTVFYNHINGLNKKVSTLEEYVADLQNKKLENNSNQLSQEPKSSVLNIKNESSPVAISANKDPKINNNEIDSKTTGSLYSSNKITAELKNNNQKFSSEKITLISIPSVILSNEKSDVKTEESSSLYSRSSQTIKNLEIAKIDHIFSNIKSEYNIKLPVPSFNSIQPVITTSKQKYFVSILADNSFSSYSMNNTPANYPDLKGYDSYYSGLGFRLDLGTNISEKFYFFVSSAFNKMNNESILIDQMLFNSDNIVVDTDGNELYKADMDIETPLGLFNTNVNFRADLVDAMDGDVMQNKTIINQTLNVLNFSLGAKYEFLEINRLNLYGSSGIGFEKVLSSKNAMQTTVSMEDKNMSEFEVELDGMDKLSKSYFSAFAGIGLSYSINENFGFVVDTRFKRSLNTLRISNGYVEPKTFLQQFNLSLGFDYHF